MAQEPKNVEVNESLMNTATNLNSHWDHDPSGYDALRDTWLNQRRDRYVLNFLSEAKEGEVVVELGSGTGSSLIWLAKERPDLIFVGIEPLRNYCDFASEKALTLGVKNVEFICGYGEEAVSFYGDRSAAKWIISTDVLHHVNDMRLTAQQLWHLSDKNARWLSFEPSCLNPYIFYFQATTKGERNFWLSRFLSASKEYWSLLSKDHITVIPSFIPTPSPFLKKIESALEGVPIVCGRRVTILEKK
jgi:SAM-dependent methyltransferase